MAVTAWFGTMSCPDLNDHIQDSGLSASGWATLAWQFVLS